MLSLSSSRQVRQGRSAQTEWLRDSLVLLHSAVAECLPATTDYYATMPKGSLGSQGEVTHCYASADRKGLSVYQYFSPAQDRRGCRDGEGRGKWGAEREGMGNKFVFFLFRFQLAIVCICQSQVLLLR